MILEYICILLLAIECAYSGELGCRRIFDKYDREIATSRNAMYGRVWPNKVIPYSLSYGFTPIEQKIIQSSLKHISDRVCVKFVEYTTQKDFVYIQHSEPGCSATLGYHHLRGKHVLNLQRFDGQVDCVKKKTIVHEMLHVMGIDHEHSRPDRNEFVQVIWNRMRPGCYSEYFRNLLAGSSEHLPKCDPKSHPQSFENCYSGIRTETFGMDYDYASIMHYSFKKCSKDGKSRVMKPLKTVPGGIVVGEVTEMSPLDIQKARAKYGCDGRTTTTPKPGVECRDSSTDCPQLKSQCTDQKIREKCKVTCGVCKECYDKIDGCPDEADKCGGSDTVDKYCLLTCGKC